MFSKLNKEEVEPQPYTTGFDFQLKVPRLLVFTIAIGLIVLFSSRYFW